MSEPEPRPKVLVTRPVPESAVDLLRASFDVEVLPEGAAIDRDLLKGAVSGADAVLALLTERFDQELLGVAVRLKVVANMAVGYDNVDVVEATRRKILVTNTPDVLTETTADLTMALLLATARRIVDGDRMVRGGEFDRWGPLMLLGPDVHGKTLGIAGMGRIGAAFARRAALGFGMKILYWSRSSDPVSEQELGARRVDKEELLSESDFLSIHVPLAENTRHFIDHEALVRMKKSAILINTARGPVVDEAALVAALEEGRIWGAGLDVYEQEPAVHPGLLELGNVVLLPHIGSASEETREGMANLAAENIRCVLSGERPPCPLNPEVLDG